MGKGTESWHSTGGQREMTREAHCEKSERAGESERIWL